MGRFKRDLKRFELRQVLASGEDPAIMQLVWAVDALQSRREDRVRNYLNHPPEAVTTDMLSAYIIQKWELETLVTLSLKGPKYTDGRQGTLRHREFAAACHATNLLREIVQQETKLPIGTSNIMLEMYKLANLQFPWQRGFFGPEQLYRYLYIYGQGQCAAYFEEQNGLSVNEFTQLATYMFFGFRDVPWLARPPFEELGMRSEAIDAGLALLSAHGPDARVKAEALTRGMGQKRVLHQRSILRTYPLLSFDVPTKMYIAPLPNLIAYRMTVGLYYDIVSGPQKLLLEANDRFEEYAKLLIKARMPRFEVLRAGSYGSAESCIDTPDLMIKDDGVIKVVCECKATKLTFDAQFADDPLETAKTAFDQMVKAVYQLWRFYAHARLGRYSAETVAENTTGIVLTMDMWFRLSSELKLAVVAKARLRAAGNTDITEADMRPVLFCSMYDLDNTLAQSTEDNFLEAVRQNGMQPYIGYELVGTLKELKIDGEFKPYPFDVSAVMPWFATMPR